jgi:hypothetical protein
MFHMLRNGPKRGTTKVELLRAAEEAIRAALPGTWTVNADPQVSRAGAPERPDGLLTIVAPDGTTAIVLVEARGVVVPRDVDAAVRQLDAYAQAIAPGNPTAAMLVARFVSPTTRAQLERHGLGWFDSTGNLRLRVEQPAVFIDRVGADRSGFSDPADRRLKSLRGPAAAKIVLELCDIAPPIGVRELAQRAQVSAATGARVLDLLNREAVVDRGKDGSVVAVRKRPMVERWAVDYQVMASNEVIPALDPRGLDHALAVVSRVDTGVVVTASAAARAYLPEDVVPVAPMVSLSFYARDPLGVMDELGFRSVERGANVLVMRPYDEVVHTKSRHVGELRCAAPAQVVADLMTGPGRSTEEAVQLVAALASSEPGWQP